MVFLIGIPLFFVIVWITATICTGKGLSLASGIALGILLQLVGRVIAALVALFMVRIELLLGAFLIFVGPLVGSFLPIAVALLLPRTREAERARKLDNVAASPCSKCGRINAVTTPVCPRCGERKVQP